MIPLSECRRRNKNEWPSPARNGATPRLSTGVAVLGEDARSVPYEIKSDKRTFYYVSRKEAKSNG